MLSAVRTKRSISPRFAAPLAAIAALIAIFLIYYFVGIAQQEASVDDRAFRSLAAVSTQFKDLVNTYAIVFGGAVGKDSAPYKKKNAGQRKGNSGAADQSPQILSSLAAEGSTLADVENCGSSPDADLLPSPQAGDLVTANAVPRSTGYSLELASNGWCAHVSIENALLPLITEIPGQIFDDIILAALMLVNIDDSTAQDLSRSSTSPITRSDCMAKLTASSPPRPGNGSIAQRRERPSGPAFKEKLLFGSLPSGSSSEPQPELGVWLLAIPAKSEQMDLALEFIKYATDLGDHAGAERLERSLLAAQRGTPPPRLGVIAELHKKPQFKNRHPSLMPAIFRSLEKGRERPRTASWKEIESRLGTYLEKLINQNVEPANITKCAKQNLTPLFNQDVTNKYLAQNKSERLSADQDN